MTSLCDIDRMIYVGYMMQAVNDVVWYKKLEWIHMQHACMLSYVSEWYWYETFVCMMHAPYEMYECKWVTYETLWRKYERMTFSGRNDAYFGKKWSTSPPWEPEWPAFRHPDTWRGAQTPTVPNVPPCHSKQSRTTPRLPVVGSRPSWALWARNDIVDWRSHFVLRRYK